MQGFRSSINLQFDLPDPKLLDRYILTPSHCDVLHGLLAGVANPDAKHAHLLIGPYGTGKSFLSTIVCQLLSRRFPEEWRASLLAQAERIDPFLAERLRKTEKTELTYIPVIINGKIGSLRTIVNQAIYRALHQLGIRIATPNESASILSTVDRWKSSYPETYEIFMRHLEDKHIQESEWRAQIEDCQEGLTQDFIAFYPSVTSGTTWSTGHEAYFVENLEQLSSELTARRIGLFIVYDEFGRYLQSLGGEDTLREMQDLQNFAEFADRTENVHLLIVGHKHIRQYAAGSRETIRSEFEKVEKRFRFYHLENDAGTFLQLAQEAIREINDLCLTDSVKLDKVETLQDYPLFAEYTAYQLERGIIQVMYPLHPVAVMLLPHLSNIFGQNERTLFSFLGDNERYSLRDHVQQNSGYYYADQLFDFFGIGQADPKEDLNLQLYHRIAPYLENQLPIQRRLVELLTMWSVALLTQKQPMTTAFLSFTLGVPLDETIASLDKLSAAKIVRFNSVRGYWELFDGSSIDLNAIIAEKLASTNLQERESMALLERHLPLTYVLPYEYNDEMDMLRYADIRFTNVEELKTFNDVALPVDDRIWLVVYRDADEIDNPVAVMQEVAKPFLAAFPHFTFDHIRSSLQQFKVIDQLLHDAAFLAQDARLKNELLYMLEETSMRIKEFVNRYFAFDELEWWSGTERKTVKDLQGLERLITLRLRNKYRHTPHIRNEAFNRNRISSIQRRALIDVIDRLIKQPEEPSLGITGFGPNYLIYATALKNNGYVINEEGGVQCNGQLEAIRDALRDRLDREPVGKLSDLVSMMEASPYGIRSSVIPLLFVALLRDRWDQLLIYSHDMLITHLSGASVLELIELSESYEYRYYNWTAEEKEQLLELGCHFDLPAEACTSFLQVADAMLDWLRRLPKFAQITWQISSAAQQVRDCIRAAEIDPYKYMKQLAAQADSLAKTKEELELFLTRNEGELERRVLDMTGQKSFSQMFSVLAKLRKEAIGKNSKLLTFMESEPSAGVIDRLAEHLVGVARTEWSDATQDLFLSQIKYEWELLHAGNEVAAMSDVPADHHVPLSKKSQMLYANVKNMLKYAGKDVSPQEVRQLLVKLLQEL